MCEITMPDSNYPLALLLIQLVPWDDGEAFWTRIRPPACMNDELELGFKVMK